MHLKSTKYVCTYALKKVQICSKNMHLYLIILNNIFISTNIFLNLLIKKKKQSNKSYFYLYFLIII
jgi:hypothetical protein